jgi:phosphohistidine phosphatase
MRVTMELLLIRHAIAEDRDSERWPDDRGRPLTRTGETRFRSVARALSRICETPDEVFSSPLRRTWQTAEILKEVCGWPAPTALPSLEPGIKAAETVASLQASTDRERVVLVGHEPSLHELLAFLLGGVRSTVVLEMKKGGAALVRCDTGVRSGNGCLLWLLPPRVILSARKD